MDLVSDPVFVDDAAPPILWPRQWRIPIADSETKGLAFEFPGSASDLSETRVPNFASEDVFDYTLDSVLGGTLFWFVPRGPCVSPREPFREERLWAFQRLS
eukprot:scaffold114_cov175-Amphora_coffeaeformis.AAC.3